MNSPNPLIARITDAANAEREALKPPPLVERPRPQMRPEAFHGVAGEIARAIDVTSEADPPAALAQLLACVGNAAGNHAHWRVGVTRHKLNLFVAVVGPTALGKKGTALGPVEWLVMKADPTWKARVFSGLSSGEGLIHFIRDASEETNNKGEPVDKGVSDKRAMFIEGELGGLLGASARQGNTLSAVLRNAWDGSTLRITTKNAPESASDPNVGGIGHITPTELRKTLSDVDAKNGLGNRFLWIYSVSKKLLPEGGEISPSLLARFIDNIQGAIKMASDMVSVPMGMTPEAWRLYGTNGATDGTMYERLNRERRGMAEHLCTRAAPQVRRMACIYALLDGMADVDVPHLRAAEAVWNYCEDTVDYVFGDALGNQVAEEILLLLRDEDMSRADIHAHFHRNKTRKEIQTALDLLRRAQLADCRMDPTDGRPRETWFLVEKSTA